MCSSDLEHLRLVNVELQMAPVRAAVHIAAADFMPLMQGKKTFADLPHLAESATQMLDQLVWWTGALKAARDKK